MLAHAAAVVLVAPRVAENVGAACRAASNYGVHDVRVAAPRCDVRGEAAARVAVGAPSFTGLAVYPTLADALADGAPAVGLSRRAGGTRRLATDPSALFGELLPRAGGPPLALVFGREEAGLTADELALCTAALSLPHINPDFGSFNLSHAVAVALSYAAEAAASGERGAGSGGEEGVDLATATATTTASPPAPPTTLDALVARVAALCGRLGLDPAETVAGSGNHGRKLRVAGHFRALAARGRATRDEVGALHALLREVEKRV